MDDFHSITKVQKANLLICFYDIANFSSISRSKVDSIEIFELLNGMAKITYNAVNNSTGYVVKFIGDSALLIFPESSIDEGASLLLSLKEKLEEFFQAKGFSIKVAFNLHFGEVALGPFGNDSHTTLEVFGDHVNATAALAKGQHRGRFVISPQVFRKLSPETRKKFHKYTPPIVYLAE